jgi:hypothetical protein
VERPYRHLTGQQIRELIDEHWDDFVRLGTLAFETQFRKLIKPERRAAVIERLVELGVSAGTSMAPDPGFEFPSADIYRARELAGTALGDGNWRETGLLRLSGYRVGMMRGKPKSERQRILNFIFLEDDLRDVNDEEYASEWGPPKSAPRLKKLSDTIASLARNAKRSPGNYAQAVEEWEEDLAYMRSTFYERWGDFPWPDTEVD